MLAELARGRMRVKIPDLTLALEGRFGEHHALWCRLHLDHIDHLDEMIARLDGQVEAMMVPVTRARELVMSVPGMGPVSTAAVLAEIGTSPAEFSATAAHLTSWAGLCPGNHESAGKREHGRPRKGNRQVRSLLVEAAWSAVRSGGRLKARYRRLVLRFGGVGNPVAKKKAIFAIAHTLIVIIWQVLATDTPYTDLGVDFYQQRTDPEWETRRLIAKLESLGHRVTLEPVA